MNKTIVHHERETSLEVADQKGIATVSTIKLGVDVHSRTLVVVAQYDHAVPKAPQRFEPAAFVPWVERLVKSGHVVHVVYEACGFGFGLYRQLIALGACSYVIAPRKLDEQRTGVKTDPRDAQTLCQRLSRYVDGNTRELSSEFPPSRRSVIDMFTANVSNSFAIAKNWRPPVAARSSTMGCQHQLTGGSRRPGAIDYRSICPRGLFLSWRFTDRY